MAGDDLDAWFRTHPRLRRYHEIYERQQVTGARRSQRASWLALWVLMAALYMSSAVRTGKWIPPGLERLRASFFGVSSGPVAGPRTGGATESASRVSGSRPSTGDPAASSAAPTAP